MSLEDAIHLAIIALKEGFEGAIDENNIEVCTHYHAMLCMRCKRCVILTVCWMSQIDCNS
jgi:hypothetical protein